MAGRRMDSFFAGPMASGWKYLLMLGVAFFLFGIIVMVFPQILVAIVASVFIFLGIVFSSIALSARNLEKMSGMTEVDIDKWE